MYMVGNKINRGRVFQRVIKFWFHIKYISWLYSIGKVQQLRGYFGVVQDMCAVSSMLLMCL